MATLIKKIVLPVFIILVFSVGILAQSVNEETAVKACLANYFSNDGATREKAFHTSAYMKYVDNKTNEFKDVPIADFIARVKANPNKTEHTNEIISLNIEGFAAQAKLKIEYPTHIFYDYMNLLKINGEWKIVSKIFWRKDR
jgi:hypothetical protein